MTAPTRSRPTRTAARGRSDSATDRRRTEPVTEPGAEPRAASTVERRRADAEPRRRTAAAMTPAKASAVATVTATPEAPARTSSGRGRSAAAQRAYARRAQREGRPAERAGRDVEPDRDHVEDHAAGRASFVILIIVLLAVGVAATLWLSTQAIADSYRLEDAKQTADQLAERADQLQREVTKAESASALAERAKAMGMVPAGDPARLVVRPDGRVVVVGEPTRAEKPEPSTPAPAPADERPGRSADQSPADQDQPSQAGNASGDG